MSSSTTSEAPAAHHFHHHASIAATLSSSNPFSTHNTPHTVPSISFAPADPSHARGLHPTSDSASSSATSSRSNSDAEHTPPPGYVNHRFLQRPKLGRRKSSGTMIVSSGSPDIERVDEEYDSGDARSMSPRRTSEEIERLAHESRQAMMDQAKMLQESLLEIVDRVESIRSQHEKLEGGNRFLQSYIGELMQTSKITSVGAPKAKGKARASK